MERGTLFLSAVAAVLFFAACAYLGAALLPVRDGADMAAEPAAVPGGVTVRGIAVRSERALGADADSAGLEDARRVSAASLAARGLFDGSAVYFDDCDGYELLSPALLDGLTPTGLDAIMSLHSTESGNGRLVTAREWYIAAYTDSALPESTRVRLRVEGMTGLLDAQIVSSAAEVGRFTVLLRLTDGSADALKMRTVAGEILPCA